VELHWSLLGLWIIQLLAFKEQTHAAEPREQTSIATVLRILRSMIKQASTKRVRGQSLQSQLAGAVTDGYERPSTKQSRNYPRRKEEPSAGAPIICPATEEHKKQLHTIQCVAQAA
jgi:hypothetical protein